MYDSKRIASITLRVVVSAIVVALFILNARINDLEKASETTMWMKSQKQIRVFDQLNKECDRRIELFKADWDKQSHWSEMVNGSGWGYSGTTGVGFVCHVSSNDEKNWIGKNYYLNENGKVIDWESFSMLTDKDGLPTNDWIRKRQIIKFEGE